MCRLEHLERVEQNYGEKGFMKIETLEQHGATLERPENVKDWRFRRIFFEEEGPHCHYCLASLTLETFEIDHFIPRSKGGDDGYSNLRVACHQCNRKKGVSIWLPIYEDEGAAGEVEVMTFEEWRQVGAELPF